MQINYRRDFDIKAPVTTPIAIPGPMPRARLPIATPIPHPIATPRQIPTPMNLPSFLSGESLIESFYEGAERPLLAAELPESMSISASCVKHYCLCLTLLFIHIIIYKFKISSFGTGCHIITPSLDHLFVAGFINFDELGHLLAASDIATQSAPAFSTPCSPLGR